MEPIHEPEGERDGEEPLAICVSGLLGVTGAHPPPGMRPQQSRGTPSAPDLMSCLLSPLRPQQLGGEKESVGAVWSRMGQLSWLPHTLQQQTLPVCSPPRQRPAIEERAEDPAAVMLSCSGCWVPAAGQAPQCQSPWTYVPARLWVAVEQEFAPRPGSEPTPSRQLSPLHLHLLLKADAARGSSCCMQCRGEGGASTAPVPTGQEDTVTPAPISSRAAPLWAGGVCCLLAGDTAGDTPCRHSCHCTAAWGQQPGKEATNF